MVDDIVVGAEDSVGEPVVTHELPDVLDRIELGRARRQREDGVIGGHVELVRGVPAGLIHDQDGMGVRGDGARYLLELERHGGAVAERQDQARALALLRADGTEDIGRAGALIVGCAGPGIGPGNWLTQSPLIHGLRQAERSLVPECERCAVWRPLCREA